MDSAALDKVLHDLAAQSKDKPVSDLEKNVVGMIQWWFAKYRFG